MQRTQLAQAFEAYVAGYNLQDPKIALKHLHTHRVAENSEYIAQSLGLSRQDLDLAWEIGMLHDIGRFEQVRRYNTFKDADSIDHAEFGADLLFKEDLMATLDPDTANWSLIELALRCHNKYLLPQDLTPREATFCQIIRDADKVDIFRVVCTNDVEKIYNITTAQLKSSPVTPAVYQAFREKHTVLRTLNRTIVDHLVAHVSLYYGLVYPASRRLALEQGYLLQLADFHSDNPETEQIFKEIRATLRQDMS